MHRCKPITDLPHMLLYVFNNALSSVPCTCNKMSGYGLIDGSNFVVK